MKECTITKVSVSHGFMFKIKLSSGYTQMFTLGEFMELMELFHCPPSIMNEINWEY